MALTTCFYCRTTLSENDPETWRQVKAWVGGPKKDHAKGREPTGFYAHGHCIAARFDEKVQSGQTPLIETEVEFPEQPVADDIELEQI